MIIYENTKKNAKERPNLYLTLATPDHSALHHRRPLTSKPARIPPPLASNASKGDDVIYLLISHVFFRQSDNRDQTKLRKISQTTPPNPTRAHSRNTKKTTAATSSSEKTSEHPPPKERDEGKGIIRLPLCPPPPRPSPSLVLPPSLSPARSEALPQDLLLCNTAWCTHALQLNHPHAYRTIFHPLPLQLACLEGRFP